MTPHDISLLLRLRKMCKIHGQNFMQAGISPGTGSVGTVFIKYPENLELKGSDYFSFRALLDRNYIELYDSEHDLYSITYKGHQFAVYLITDTLGIFLQHFLAPIIVAIITALLVAS